MASKKMDEPKAPARMGRPPLQEGVETVVVPVRMTAPQRDKLKRLGGAPWVRQRIDKAKEPEPD